MKIWSTEIKGNEKIIAYIDEKIYRINPKSKDFDVCLFDLKQKKLPMDNFFAIPLPYLKQVNMQEGKNYIEFLFGADSTEHFRVTDAGKRTEIFDFFKATIPNLHYSVERQTRMQAGKKPLIAIIVLLLLFCWTFYITRGMELGNQYDVEGGHYNSFAGLVLILASLGMTNVLSIFGVLIAIAVFAFVRKIKNPPVVSRLTKQRSNK